MTSDAIGTALREGLTVDVLCEVAEAANEGRWDDARSCLGPVVERLLAEERIKAKAEPMMKAVVQDLISEQTHCAICGHARHTPGQCQAKMMFAECNCGEPA